jgi:perosamine synthetase
MIPYGKQTIDQGDIECVIKVLEENNYLTTGPRILEFEKKICNYIGSRYGIAVNSGTAALHGAMFAIDITKGDEVIVPAISFVASSNCVLYQNGTPIFCDIEPDTLNIDVNKIEELITAKTKAIVMVDMCGQPCKYDKIRKICNKYNIILIQDAAHSLGAHYNEMKVGSYADITCLSFHPVKNITTCEGGMIITNSINYYEKCKIFRTHGIIRDYKERDKSNTHYYDMTELGYNYRIPDILCALGINQLNKLDNFIKRRNEIANRYNSFFLDYKNLVEPLKNYFYNAYHIYVVKLKLENLNISRDDIFKKMKEANIGVNVHYIPIYYHTYYKKLGYKKGLCPVSENTYEKIITLPIYPLLENKDIDYVCKTLLKILSSNKK